MAKARYGREILRRAGRDWESANLAWLVRTIALGLVGGPGVTRLAMGPSVKLSNLLVGALGGVGAALLWGLFVFMVGLLRAPGKLLDERDSKLALLSMGPTIAVSAGWEGNNLLLVVRNVSALATFWAVIRHESGSMKDWPEHEIFAKWDHQNAVRAEIPRAGNHRLVVGQLYDEHRPWPSGQWSVPFTSDQQTGKATATGSFLYGTSDDNRSTIPGSTVAFRVTIYSAPDMAGGPVRVDVVLSGGAPQVNSRNPAFKGPTVLRRGA